MRYDKRITFVKLNTEIYDPATGDYDVQVSDSVTVPASVMDTSAEVMNLVYGHIQQGSLVIHIQNHYADDFDRIMYNGRSYRVDYQRKLRTKETFVVSEVQ